jgi:sortase B
MGKEQRAQVEQQRNKQRQRIILCLAVVATIIAAVLAFKVIPYVSDMIAFRREQASLPDISPFDAHWLDINPDYVGWLKIDGMDIHFPVVRGSDNEKYLTTTFTGEENILGAVFMDYRCTGENPHIIIYGHQVHDEQDNKLVFGSLHEFIDELFLAEHPTIMWMENDSLYEFEIFKARQTDIYDPAYLLDFSDPGSWAAFLDRNGAPAEAEQVITLSTCIGADNDRRMIVQGALKRVVQVTTEQNEDGGWKIVMPPE